MTRTLHITSGDIAGGRLAEFGIPGEVFVWHDIFYDGPRKPGWPGEDTFEARALFLEQTTGGGLKKDYILETLKDQYSKLFNANQYVKKSFCGLMRAFSISRCSPIFLLVWLT